MDLLTENVVATIITPYVQLKLLPKGSPDWGLETNNNWIKVDNAIQSLEEEVTIARQSIDNIGVNLDVEITSIRSAVENEAIERSDADAALQAQIPSNIAVYARFSNCTLTAGSSTLFTHILGKFPQVSVIRQIGVGGIDVTNAFDTLVQHIDVNQISITVGISGTYTIICVA